MFPDLNTAHLKMTSKHECSPVDNNCRILTYLHLVTQLSPGSVDYSPSINKNLLIPHPFVVSRESVLASCVPGILLEFGHSWEAD